jgi:hypothetical protein
LDLALFLAGCGLLLCLFQRGQDADQVAANERASAAFVKGWTADGTSLAGRRVVILVSDRVETSRVLDLPDESRLGGWARWGLRRLGLRRAVSAAELFESVVPVPEWTVETRGWAVPRREMVSALAGQIMRLIEGHGTVDLVVQGEVADFALEAAREVEKLAPPESRTLLRKVVVVGAVSVAAFEKPGRVREWVFFWRESGGEGGSESVLKAVAHTRRFKGEVFEGEDLLFTEPPKQGWYSDKEIVAFVQRLLQSDLSMEDYMMLAQRRPPSETAPPLLAPIPAPAPPLEPAPAPEPAPIPVPAQPPAASTDTVRDPSALVLSVPAEEEPQDEAAPKAPPKPDQALESPLRLLERSVRLAGELAKRNAERAAGARESKLRAMAGYGAAKQEAAAKALDDAAGPRTGPGSAATQAPAATQVPSAGETPPSTAPPLKGGRIAPFKSGPKVTREQLDQEDEP